MRVRDGLNEQAFLGIAWDDGWAILAAFKQAIAEV